MLCQLCGAHNPSERDDCLRCGNKLLVVSGLPEDDEEGSEELLFQAQEELEEHLLERISNLEDGVRQLSHALAAAAQHIAQLEHNLTVTHAGVQALGGLLETQGIVSSTEVEEGWERTVSSELLSRDLSRRFAQRAPRILSKAVHDGHATPAFRNRLRALELALVGNESQAAEDLLGELVRMASDNDELWSFIGEAAFESGDLDSARIAFRRVLDLRGPHYESLIYLGTAASDLGHWEEAKGALEAARQMAPESFLPHFTLGALAALRGDCREALPHLETCRRLEEAPQGLYLEGQCHLRLGHAGRAIALLRRAVELAPDFEDALYQLGVAYTRRGWTRLALETFEQVLRLDPQRLRYQEAVRLLQVSPPRDLTGEAARQVHLAETALEHGRHDRALDHFAEALSHAPEEPVLHATAALLASSLGRGRQAVRHAHRLLRLAQPDSPYMAAAVVALLESLRDAGRLRSAGRIARRMLEQITGDLARSMAIYELALVESELADDLEGARQLARDALEITPKELRHYPLAALGVIALKRGRYREASQYLEQATEAGAVTPLLQQLAMARLGSGDADGAAEALEVARTQGEGGLDEELLGHVRRMRSLIESLPVRQRASRAEGGGDR